MKSFIAFVGSIFVGGSILAQPINVISSNFGDAAANYSGLKVGLAGDLNADGISDRFATGFYPNNAALRVFSGLDGSQLLELTAPETLIAVPIAAAVGDINADGTPDFIVSDVLGGPNQVGVVWAFSGADGSVLYSFNGTNPIVYLGYYLAPLNDVNADGRPDYVVSPISTGTQVGGAGLSVIQVRSGLNGNVIYSILPALGQQTSIDDFRSIADVNNDGQRDIAMTFAVQTGYVIEIRSGVNGALITSASSVSATAPSVLPGVPSIIGVQSITQIDALRADINSDGVNDFVIGDPAFALATDGIAPRGAIHFLSGANLTNLLATVTGVNQGEYLGSVLAAIGDADNNGVPDVAVASTGSVTDPISGTNPNPGYVRVYAAIPTPLGGFGIMLGSMNFSGADSGSVVHLAAMGDINSDGFAEFLLGNTAADNGAVINAGQASMLTLTANYVPPVPVTSPSPVPSPSASASPGSSPIASPSASPIGNASPSPSPTGSGNASPSASPSPSQSANPSPMASPSPSASLGTGGGTGGGATGSPTPGPGVGISSLPDIGLSATLRRGSFRVNIAPVELISSSVFNNYSCAMKLEASTRTGSAFDKRAISLAYIPYSASTRILLRANRLPLVRVKSLKSKPKVYLRANVTCTRPSQVAGTSEALVRDSSILAIKAPKTTKRSGVSLGKLIGRMRKIIAL